MLPQNADISSLLAQIPGYTMCRVAYSGGADSTALLHILYSRKAHLAVPLRAVHVDHQLHDRSAEWAQHCRQQCNAMGIKLDVLTVNASPPRGESPEAWARKSRYDAIDNLMSGNDILFTAHNKDDQVETLLLQLIRGAGPDGLASMPVIRRLQMGWLVRPLLQFSREELREYNRQNGLQWIEDSSNQDTRVDRNYLRQVIMPSLVSRWPGAPDTISRSAKHQAELMQIARELAEIDAENVISGSDSSILCINRLQALSIPRQKNLLRYWIRSNRFSLPGRHIIQRLLSEVIPARADALPGLHWDNAEIRRYRDRLYLMPKLIEFDNSLHLEWDMREELVLPHGRLQAARCSGQGIRDSSVRNHAVTVTFRKGGEAIQLPGHRHRKTLKNLFQETDIPVWERDRLPLLFVDGNLAAVAGHWIDANFRAAAGEDGWSISFRAD